MIWQTKKLSDVCIIKPPKSEAREKLGDNDLVSFLPMEDLGILCKDISLSKERKLKEVSGSYTYFADGDVLLAKITPCFENGKLGIARSLKNGIGFGSSEYIVFRPIKDLLSEYLFYFFLGDQFRQEGKKSMSGAVGHKRVSKEFIENYQIPAPHLSEQLRIVKILDDTFSKIDQAKENTKKNLQNAKEVFESYLLNIFEQLRGHSSEKKISSLCITRAGGTPLKSHGDYYQSGIIPWLRSGEVCKKEIKKSELYITQKGLNNSSAKILPKNTVLVAMYGATAGQTGILKFESSTNQAICGILPNNNLLPEFIYYFFKAIKKELVKQAVGGAQPNISQIKIKNTFVPYISTSEQKLIVKKLDQLSAQTKKLEAIYQKKLEDLEELKKSILQRAFNGDL